MKQYENYPIIEKYLKEETIVQAWTIDDVARSLKNVEQAIQKLEVLNAKEKKDSWSRSSQAQQLTEIQKLMKRLTEQMNRLLGISF